MTYRCKSCKREFPAVAWIETVWVPTPPPSTDMTVYAPEYNITTTVRKPCCPFCHSIEIEEVKG